MSDAKFGVYSGKVVETSDPLNKGRVRALVPAALGDQKSNWCVPLVRTKNKDRVGDIIFVQFVDGNLANPVFNNPAGLQRDLDEIRAEIAQHKASPHP